MKKCKRLFVNGCDARARFLPRRNFLTRAKVGQMHQYARGSILKNNATSLV
jgi:hypothetical protein